MSPYVVLVMARHVYPIATTSLVAAGNCFMKPFGLRACENFVGLPALLTEF